MQETVVYVLQHEYWLEDHDEFKLLGIFSDRELAEESKAYFATQEGFCDHLDGFEIDEVTINKRLWSEGFFTYRYPIDPKGY
jgi:hypothetical protein